nr:hypothetical protein BaRGS_020962 [Batillaria attramentaria]
MEEKQRKGGEGIGSGGKQAERQRSDGKMEMKPPNRGAGDGPVVTKEGRESNPAKGGGAKDGKTGNRVEEDKNQKKQQKEEEERRKREEEAERKEKEKQRLAEEKRKQEEEAKRKAEEEAEKIKADELRLLTESQKDSLAKDFNGLNLSKYVEEAATALAEAKLKMSDVQCAVYLCSLIHQRYDNFAPFLLENFQKCLMTKKDDGKISNPSKYRVDLRFFGELVSVGVFRNKEGLPVLASQLQLLVASDREEHNHLSILTSFCRHCGDDYMGLVPRKIRLLAEKHGVEIPQSETKGELSQERRETHETAYNNFQKLYSSASALADLLDEDMPEFPVDENMDDGGGTFDIFNPLKDSEILYKDSEQSSSKDGVKDSDTVLEEDMGQLEVEEVEKEMETARIEESMKEAEAESGTQVDEDEVHILPPEAEEDDTETGSLMKQQFDAYLLSLPNCVNRDLIDKAAIEFCMNFNTKTNRKKLVRGLFTVHRTRYDLLPFYARLVATLYPCMPDVANELVQYVKSDLRWHIRKKDQINIESKLKTVRYLGELVKFNMCPKSEALHCLKDVMMRKKMALHLDSRYETMIENAYFYSNPPENTQSARQERPPMHNYIRKLLYKDLSKVTTEKVLRQMRKLNWDDPEEHVAIQVVDGVLEEIRLGMEINHPKYNQRRVSCVKYLGELYNYRMVESTVIFRILYSLITFGVSLDVDVENMIRDTFEAIRPKMRLATSYDEANSAVQALEEEYKAKIVTEEEEEAEAEEDGLSTILENDEDGTQDSDPSQEDDTRPSPGSQEREGEEEGDYDDGYDDNDVLDSAAFDKMMAENIQAERMEKERMKQMVLNIHERQEEEDYQEMLASLNRSPPTNLNRERRVRYQHPKGAPDADLIFGSGSK